MKKSIIISIILLLPVTASAYSLLQPETFNIRLSQASFLLAEEQPVPPPAEQPAPDMTQEQKSPALNTRDKAKTLKPKSYWFPIIWDLAPIPLLSAWAAKCSTAKNVREENECSDPLIKATFISIPLWSILPTVYVQPPTPVPISLLLPIGTLLSLATVFGIYKAKTGLEDMSLCCMGDSEGDSECCQKSKEEKKEEYIYLIVSASIIQVAEGIAHLAIVKKNNDLYEEQQLENQVYITPYVGKDRAGLAFQYSF